MKGTLERVRFRRNAFVLMAVLALVLTILVGWLAIQVEVLYARLACSPWTNTPDRCPPDDPPIPWLLLILIAVIGGLITLSFAWLGWQETLILRQQRRRDQQLHIFDSTDMIVPLPENHD